MGYWNRTTEYLRQHGSAPNCPNCGEKMFAEDDHGRFRCFCGDGLDTVSGTRTRPQRIAQVDTSGMTDEDKSKVPAINRLQDTPTAAEAEFFRTLLTDPDSPEHMETQRALEKERRGE